MRVLIVDNDRSHIKAFKQNLRDDEIKITSNQEDAIISIINEKWDVLYLGFGITIAHFLNKHFRLNPPEIYIHDPNYDEATVIRNAIGCNAIIFPMAWHLCKRSRLP
jgi:hypothetical protein